MTIKLYSNKQFLPINVGTHADILAPFWGPNSEPAEYENFDRFAKYVASGHEHYSLVQAPEDCDFAVLPTDWKRYIRNNCDDIAHRFVSEMTAIGKKTLVFYFVDSEEAIPLTNTIVFRTSLSKQTRLANEYALPAFTPDYLSYFEFDNNLVLNKPNKPTVGFMGNAEPRLNSTKWNVKQIMKFMINKIGLPRRLGTEHYLETRKRCLEFLNKAQTIQANFVIRNGYFGNAHSSSGWDIDLLEQRRKDYLQNMRTNAYTLCIRGSGNFSFRFYETLSLGRIPIFIDTDCVLPFEHSIHWKQYGIWIDYAHISELENRILAFHQNITEKDFAQLQHNCRMLWQRICTPEGFFRQLAKELTLMLENPY